MSVVINTNVNSIKIQRILNNSTDKLSQSMQRMSTGLKINSAKDDAAGTVIAAKMNVQLNGNEIAQKNVQNASAMLSTAEANIDVVSENVSRIRDLTLQAKNGTYSDDEILAMDNEVQQRIAEINRVSDSAKYSSSKLFDGNGEAKKFQVGSDAGADNTITAKAGIFKTVKFSEISGLQNFSLKDLINTPPTIKAGLKVNDVATDDNYDKAIRQLDKGIDDLTARKSEIGSASNRLDSALSTLTTQYENLSSSKSLITDADIASEASKYTQNQILQQISASLLTQANSSLSIAMNLI